MSRKSAATRDVVIGVGDDKLALLINGCHGHIRFIPTL